MEIKKHFCSFSEAIREGAKLRPQAFGNFFEYLMGAATGSCAIGAGVEAVTGESRNKGASAILSMYPYIGDVAGRRPCAAGCGRLDPLWGNIIHLNDDHHWTREAIADWLESEEEKLGYVLLTEEPETCNTKDSVRTPEFAGVLIGD